MNGDFTRDTFRPGRHFQQVLRQQGRVGLDADHNEQTAIDLRRAETGMADIVGGCGGPADHAAFRIVTTPAALSDADYATLRVWVADQIALNPQPLPPTSPLPANKAAAVLGEGDFVLMPGRYYVHGIQCELEHPVLYRLQPDRLDVPALPKAAADKDYAVYLDVWRRHVTALEDEGIRDPALGGVDTATRAQTVWQVRTVSLEALEASPCASGVVPPPGQADPGTARLTAFTSEPVTDKDPCLLPPESGYTGLENQLYRIEVHDATRWKWSRENGSVTAVIERLLASEPGKPGGAVIVDSLGRDEFLEFHEDDLVEIVDDGIELEDRVGQLLRVVRVDPGTRKLELDAPVTLLVSDPAFPQGVNPRRHPKIRRWEGVARIVDAQVTAGLTLENGIRVRFEKKDELGANCVFRPRHFWLIPARSATATALNGDIEWPLDRSGKRLALPPRGVAHHHGRIGVVRVAPSGAVSVVADCRCLWPDLTSIPRLFHVGGDGQEAIPAPAQPVNAVTRYVLPQPFVVAVANGHCADRPLLVRFEVQEGAGQLGVPGGAPVNSPLDVPVSPDGTASAQFFPDGVLFAQSVRARLLDAFGVPAGAGIRFSATLSAVRLDLIGGDGQDGRAGVELPLPLEVGVTGIAGPIQGAIVSFLPTAGTVTAAAPTDALGRTRVLWTPGSAPETQQVAATLSAVPGGAVPRGNTEVRFTANLRGANIAGGSCCVVIGPGGDFPGLAEALADPGIRQQRDLCFCLQAGDHVVGTSLTVAPAAGMPFHVSVRGCGAPTRILLQEAPLRVEGATSFALRDLEIDTGFIRDPIQFLKVERVLIDGCRIHTDRVLTDLVRTAGVEDLEIRDSTLACWLDAPAVRPIPGIPLVPATGLVGAAALSTRLEGLGELASRLGIQGLPPLVEYWRAGELTSRVDGPALRQRYDAAVERLARAAASGAAVDFRTILPDLTFGRALVVGDPLRSLVLRHSAFLGGVHLLGTGAAATIGEFQQLLGASPTGFDLAKRLQRALGEWSLEDCDLQEVTLDRRSLPDALDAPILRQPERGQWRGNVVRSGFVPFLAGLADLSQNQFLGPERLVAAGGGDAATVVGNGTRGFERQILARFGTTEAGLNARIAVAT